MATRRQQSEVHSQHGAIETRHSRARSRRAAIGSAVLIAALAAAPAGAGTSGGAKAGPVPTARSVGGQPGNTPDARTQLLGASLAEWTQRFWIRAMSIPLNVNPVSDTTGIHCGISQEWPVWFLAASAGSALNLNCTIPGGRVILVPASSYLADYPCPKEFGFEPAPGQTLESFLSYWAAYVGIDGVTAKVTLDGKSVPLRRVNSGLFAFAGAADMVTADPCITGAPQLGVADGLYAFIDPPSRGKHTLLIQSTSPILGETQNTIVLNIQ